MDLGQYQAHLQDFLNRANFEPCSLGGVPFWINPDSITYHTEEQISVQPTLSGALLIDWNALVPTWTLDGMTGTSGVAGLKQLDALRPTPKGPKRPPTSFRFPSRFSDARYVLIAVCDDSVKPEAHLYNFYHLELYEVPRPQPAVYRSVDPSLGAAISVPARG